MATWKEHIERYTREISITDMTAAHLGEVIAETINEWIEEAGLPLLYKHSIEKVAVTNTVIDCTDYKIINVFREDKV